MSPIASWGVMVGLLIGALAVGFYVAAMVEGDRFERALDTIEERDLRVWSRQPLYDWDAEGDFR